MSNTEADMLYDNPAARLLAIIEKGKQKPPTSNCREVWQELLDTANNEALTVYRLGRVMELPSLAVKAISEVFPHHSDTCAHWVAQVNSAFFGQNLNSNWNSFIGNIDQHSVTYLRLSSELLQTKSNTRLLADINLSELRDQINKTLKDVVESSLPDELKRYLVGSLHKVIQAIDEYKISGAVPVVEAIDSVIGRSYFDSEYHSFLFDSDLGKTMLGILSAASNVVTVAAGIPMLAPTLIQIMPLITTAYPLLANTLSK